jgi:dihydroorotate dehydrogenase
MPLQLTDASIRKNSYCSCLLHHKGDSRIDLTIKRGFMNKIFAEQGYEFEGVPFGPGAGAINGQGEEEMEKNVIDVARSQAEGVKWGSLTWNGGPGNTETYNPVFYHNPATGQTVNSIGLANIGIKKGVAFQQKLQPVVESYGKPFMPSVSPGKGEDPTVVLPAMVYALAEVGAKIVEVNYSCPNKLLTGEQREAILSHDRERVEEIDTSIRHEVGPEITIIRKEAPAVGEHRGLIPIIGDLYGTLSEKDAVNLSNTIGGQRIPNELGDPALGVPGNLGGMSGPYTKEAGRDQLKELRPRIPIGVGIISCLGVNDGYEVYHRVHHLGADYTEGVTVFWENKKHGISFGQTVDRIASHYAEVLASAI